MMDRLLLHNKFIVYYYPLSNVLKLSLLFLHGLHGDSEILTFLLDHVDIGHTLRKWLDGVAFSKFELIGWVVCI